MSVRGHGSLYLASPRRVFRKNSPIIKPYTDTPYARFSAWPRAFNSQGSLSLRSDRDCFSKVAGEPGSYLISDVCRQALTCSGSTDRSPAANSHA